MSEANPDRELGLGDPEVPVEDPAKATANGLPSPEGSLGKSVRLQWSANKNTRTSRVQRLAQAAQSNDTRATGESVTTAKTDAAETKESAVVASKVSDAAETSKTQQTPVVPEEPRTSILARARTGASSAAALAKEKVTAVSNAVAPPEQETQTSTTPTTRPRPTRRARLRISRIDPASVMKTSALFGVAGYIIFVVATYVVMSVVEATGLFDAINRMAKDVLSSPSDSSAFDITSIINTNRVTGLAAILGAINVLISVALATVISFLYNLSATMVGGLEITLAED